MLVAAIGVVCVAAAVWFGRSAHVRANIKHEPIEYYLGWDGYAHPISLHHKITRDEADAYHADGKAYLIARYDEGRLTRVTKMLNGAVFFDFEYTYDPDGRCRTVKTTSANGVVKVREYDRSGRGLPNNPRGFW